MPASVVRCTNQGCPHVGQDRRVEMTEAGPGLYHRIAVVCACGNVPRTLDGWVPQSAPRTAPSAPAAPERAVKSSPEKRGRRAR